MTDENEPQTILIASAERNQVALIRHRLRGAIRRIASDCERLYADLHRPTHRAWRDSAGRAMLAARLLQSIVDATERVQNSTGLADLTEAIRVPHGELLDALGSVLTFIPSEVEDELLLEDARTIRDAALALEARAAAVPRGETSAPSTAADTPPDGTPADGTGARVLIVDDDAIMREQLEYLLTMLGHRVSAAENGKIGLEKAERELPDLVITDLSMPTMDGHELLARLKQSKATQHIPVVVVSGDGDAESVVRCLENGAEDHLTKPYEPVILQARIRTSLERKRMRDGELLYRRRVAKLTAAAEAVERRAYVPELLSEVASSSDHLAHLAQVFDRMATGVRAREAQLQARLRGLQKEIQQVATSAHMPKVSQESQFSSGEIIAQRYEIRRELGAGGMGTVYLAHDRELKEDVAVKMLLKELIAEHPSHVERLKLEMRMARRISHRNVVRVHDIGEWKGSYYITMEFIDGVTVGDLIERRGQLTLEATLAIGVQLADALAVAHDEKIVHRDVKPANLMVDGGGVLKVTDFGLARPVKFGERLTLAGYIVGTPLYMPPEALVGGDVDFRADLWAAGVVLFECLTGSVPFDALTPSALLGRIQQGPPLYLLGPEVPVSLRTLLSRLLEPDLERRLGSARELSEELTQVTRTG